MTVERKIITEFEIQGRRLGRHVAHDTRSWRYPAPMAAEIASVNHSVPATLPLDQGNLGSCTGNALVGMLMSDFFLNNTLKVSGGRALNEDDAIHFYSRGTHIDRYKGFYPPTDTGSNGLAVCKAAAQEGYLTGYGWSFGLEHALRTLTLQPTIAGTLWLSEMDSPSSDGIVTVGGSVRGGHEYLQTGLIINDYDNLLTSDNNFVECLNSWGDWALGGKFLIRVAEFGKLLKMQGDVKTGILQ